jgi:hypothetical protein
MERKLNPVSFWRRFRKHDNYASLATSQYWNLLVYIDVFSSIVETITG